MGMIGIKIGGELIDLMSESRLSFDLNNPIFSKENLLGSYSFPFDLPITDRNRRIMGFTHLIAHRGTTSQWETVLSVGGIDTFKGYLKLIPDGITASKIRVSFIVDGFALMVKGKTLKDYITQFNYEVELDFSTNTYTNFFAWLDAHINGVGDFSSVFAFPTIRNEKLIEECVVSPTALKNGATSHFMNPPEPTKNMNISIAFYLRYLLRAVFETEGYNLTGEHLRDDYKNLIAYSAVCYSFEYPASMAATTNIKFKASQFCPTESIADTINKLRNTFGWSFIFDSLRSTCKVVSYENLMNADVVDWSDKITDDYSIDYPDASKGYIFDYEKDSEDKMQESYLQKMYKLLICKTPTEGLEWFINRFGGEKNESELIDTAPSLGTNTIYLVGENYYYHVWSVGNTHFYEPLTVKLIGEVDNFAALPLTGNRYGDVYRLTQENRVYAVWHAQWVSLTNTIVGQWFYLAHEDWQPVRIGLQEQTKKTMIPHPTMCSSYIADWKWEGAGVSGFPPSPPTMDLYDVLALPNGGIVRTPIIDQDPIYEVKEDTKIPLKLLFMRGTKTWNVYNATNRNWVFATPDDYDHLNQIDANARHSLKWYGDNGLYRKNWERWLEDVETGKTIQFQVRLTILDIRNPPFDKRIKINGQLYFLVSIKLGITEKIIPFCTCIFRKF